MHLRHIYPTYAPGTCSTPAATPVAYTRRCRHLISGNGGGLVRQISTSGNTNDLIAGFRSNLYKITGLHLILVIVLDTSSFGQNVRKIGYVESLVIPPVISP